MIVSESRTVIVPLVVGEFAVDDPREAVDEVRAEERVDVCWGKFSGTDSVLSSVVVVAGHHILLCKRDIVQPSTLTNTNNTSSITSYRLLNRR